MKTSDSVSEPANTPAERPTWPSVIAAPWVNIRQPGRAAAVMAAASRRQFWTSSAVGVATLYLVILLLSMWNATVLPSRLPPADESAHYRSFAQVWSDWHANSIVGPAEKILLLILFLAPAGTAFCAWMFLPTVHRFGRVRESFGRSFRAMTAGIGIFSILVFVLYGLFVATETQDDSGDFLDFLSRFALPLSVIAGGGLLASWLGRAAKGAAGPEQQLSLPPCCEGCGYDLTHVPANGRCPECGLREADSTTPNLRRHGARWQNDPSAHNWLQTSFAVLVSPGRFYSRLKLRGPDGHARRFATVHYAAIAAGAMISTFVLVVWGRGPAPAMCAIPLFSAFLVPLVCWSVHRFIGAVVTSWCISMKHLPDAGWAAAVIAYESTFLWIPCGFVGLCTASFVVFGNWMTRLPLRSPLPGMPVEPVFVLIGCTVIGLAWFWRYRSAIRSIRWSNF